MGLTDYTLLGRSGLRVSRLALGGMTFGTPWTGLASAKPATWGMDERTTVAVLSAYVEAGGNFLDTSDHYGRGASEEAIGKFMAEGKLRDRLVVATKAGFSGEAGNPNAGGSGRKNILRALDGSLRRLGTDYIDLYILHVWDGLTPVDEILRTFDDLVRSGKVRHIGLSNVPARFAVRFQTLAEVRGHEPACSLQLNYSLIERNSDFELIPLCRDHGIGITVYSPLAGGFLSGKYQQTAEGGSGAGRLGGSKGSARGTFSARNWDILATLKAVADEAGRSLPQVALNWAANRPGIASVIIGATSVTQLNDNLAALDFVLSPEAIAKLDEVSAPTAVYPHSFLKRNANIILGASVEKFY